MTTPLVLGADAGGTATRVVLATLDGRIVGRGRASAGNPVASGPTRAASALGAAIREALTGHDPGRVAGAVVGLAGVARLTEPEVAAAYATHWSGAGLTCPVRPVGDALVAFAAGAPTDTGTVLIAGTGSVAAVLHQGKIGRIADGLGWLLGDEGSGYWLGLASVRATARALYRDGPPTRGSLGTAVCEHIGATEPDAFVTRVYQLDRDRIAALAPTVADCARAGDTTARDMIGTAARRLADTLLSLHPAPGPVVLAGGVLTGIPEVRAAVQQRLASRLGQPGVVAGDGAAGAAWLATLLVAPHTDQAVHTRLLAAS